MPPKKVEKCPVCGTPYPSNSQRCTQCAIDSVKAKGN